jgi:hypothetical protein
MLGLVNASSIFQRIMDLVLAGLYWETCVVLIDDIIVMPSTFEQHVERLIQVSARFESAKTSVAADSGISAVLRQYQEGEILVITHASRTLTRTEHGYCTTRGCVCFEAV